jgi:hypothetical protein
MEILSARALDLKAEKGGNFYFLATISSTLTA